MPVKFQKIIFKILKLGKSNMNIIEEDMIYLLPKINWKLFNNKTVLITGGSGLIGSYFVKYFEYLKTIKKLNIDLHTTSKTGIFVFKNEPLTHSHIGDLTNLDFINTLPKSDYIFHAAGYGQPDKFQNNEFETIILNSQTLISLLKKVNDNGRLLYCSSSEIYSGLEPSHYRESQIGNLDSTHPRSAYIEGKRIGETICRSFNNQNLLHSKKAFIVRISATYGPGYKQDDTRVLYNFIEDAIQQGEIKLLDSGQNLRAYCYISDAIEMCLKVILIGSSDIYNIGGTEIFSIRELALLIGKLTNSKITFPKNKNKPKLGAPSSVILDMTKTIVLCKKRSFLPLIDGLSRTINWRKNLAT